MNKYLYSFAAKEIQKYILESDKLKDMIGGSEIINALCIKFLPKCLDDLGVKNEDHNIITLAAGWARIVFYDEKDVRLMMKYWPFLVSQYAPGLTIVQSCIQYINNELPCAIEKSERQLRIQRNFPEMLLPEIGPLIERNQRTGIAAVSKDIDGWIDGQIRRKRAIETSGLIEKITDSSIGSDEWPKDMEVIADEKRYLAVIHADGNSLGKMLIGIGHYLDNNPEKAQKIYKKRSDAIEEATSKAAMTAYKEVLLPDRDSKKEKKDQFFAARPIVIGGDDLTMIVRDDLAFRFTEIYLESFEKESKKSFDKHLRSYGITSLPEKLTACAGILFVKSGFPYWRAYDLAESLCRFAKGVAKANLDGDVVPSCVAFHKISNSIAGDYDEIRKKELTSHKGEVKFWMGPYGVGIHKNKLITFENLKNLAEILYKIPSGSVRELITTLYNDFNQAKLDINRIIKILDDSGKKKLAVDLRYALKKLTKDKNNLLTDAGNRTPLLDAHRYNELTH